MDFNLDTKGTRDSDMSYETSLGQPGDLGFLDYKNMLDSSNIGYVLLDMNETVLEVNRTLLKMTQTLREETIGAHLSDIYKSKQYEALRSINLKMRQNKRQYQFEYFIRQFGEDEDSKIPVLFSISFNRDSQGRPVSENVMITNISEQKRTQEELRQAYSAITHSRDKINAEKNKLETILFGIGDCVTIFDPDGKLLLSNPKGKEIRGDRQQPLLPLDSGKKTELTLSVNSDKHHYQAQIKAIYDSHNCVCAFVEILKDLTDQVRLEEQEKELFRIRRQMKRVALESHMIGKSRAMQQVFDLILRCAEVDSTVLITGETGVGKELAAHSIHKQSGRKDKPFVAINCGALPDNLLESELFGYVKGAFTGAVSDRRGMFREAEGGTIFLDEIGDLSGSLQVKLLRVLQEKELRPLGCDRTYPANVRVLAATNRNLKQMVDSGMFRNDLYYRLAVIPLSIPSLNERQEDIPILLEHMILKHRRHGRKSPRSFNKATHQVLLNYQWPGNIRELENCVEYSLAMARGDQITPDDLPLIITDYTPDHMPVATGERRSPLMTIPDKGSDTASTTTQTISKMEKQSIIYALQQNDYNRTRAAETLGISRSTIIRKIKKYDLNDTDK